MNAGDARSLTFDEIALRLLVRGGPTMQRDLDVVHAIADTRHLECPECGSTGEKESNDDRRDPCLLCPECGTQFEQVTQQQRLFEALDLQLDAAPMQRKGPRRAGR